MLCAAPQARADDAELRARVERLAAEVEALRAELTRLNATTEAVASQQEATTETSNRAPASESGGQQTTLFGYGEINYNRPRGDSSEARMDLRRAVLGVGHRFDERTRFMTEIEFEHAVTSADDKGEAEIEQFWIDHRLAQNASLKAGLFLIPSGLLNESHEPNHYYGVERNFVETAIIPTTWREGGLGVYGSTEFGLAWDAGITTGFDLTKWDASSSDGRESPLGSIHQELQLAKARDLSVYGALNWRGVPGLTVGGSVFTGKAGQASPDFPANDARVTLWETHARWTPGRWDLSALYAKGTISHTEELNLAFAGQPTPVPSEFFGWYAQAAWRVWESGSYMLTPFLRYERFNTAGAFAALADASATNPAQTESVTTVGLSFNLNPNVVLKSDYQKFSVDSFRDRFNLGLGLSF
jgi:outer membrane murein-binding lipoprotein Lpp